MGTWRSSLRLVTSELVCSNRLLAAEARAGERPEVFEKPVGGEAGDFLQRAGLLEEMCCAGDDGEGLLPVEHFVGFLVEFKHRFIAFADDQEHGSLDAPEGIAGEVGPAAARNDG